MVSGVDIWSADLKEAINILLQTHLVTLDHVQAYYGWIFGDENYTLTKSADMIIKETEPNKPGNIVLLNHDRSATGSSAVPSTSSSRTTSK